MRKYLLILFYLASFSFAFAQSGTLTGKVSSGGKPLEFVSVGILGTSFGTATSSNGTYTIKNIPAGTYKIRFSSIGFISANSSIVITADHTTTLNTSLQVNESQLNEVVVTGTMRENFKSQSPVPIDVITAKFFLKNPSPSIFEAMSMVNGVQPQLNCNVCNTGDIHINGMEGPYTMITIDGMPIVSSLSTVYGLSGIPNSMVQRVEVVKGPASTLYGSEAVGGLVNIITKNPQASPKVAVDIFGTSNLEINNDVSVKANINKTSTIVGVNYFNFKNKMDKNNDNFTDVTIQDRISIFNKWNFSRKDGRLGTIAGRYVYEDRWGGELQWTPKFRGGDSIYGESIYTTRYEVLGAYELPIKEKITFQFSYTNHHQNSAYGKTSFVGQQNIAFGQLLWDKELGSRHKLLVGLPFRYTFYDDNTIGTYSSDSLNPQNKPQSTLLPGLFIQDEMKVSEKLTTLAGVRYDYNTAHGNIFSPRLSFKYSIDPNHTIRLSGGNGYRIVNLFTEDHAALTGARKVVIKNKLRPEQSYNVNLNYTGFINHNLGIIGLDGSIFYTYFTNKIVGDFLTNPDEIIYDNLNGYAVSKGISLNTDFQFTFPLKVLLGGTLMDVYSIARKEEMKIKTPQLHAPRFSGTFALTYTLSNLGITIDYTGKVMGPMHLPVLENDFRPAISPWFTLQNIQLTKKVNDQFEIYGGAKNIFNFVPKNALMRPDDPFDKRIAENNPNNFTFDTTYNYAPILGARAFLGLRYVLK